MVAETIPYVIRNKDSSTAAAAGHVDYVLRVGYSGVSHCSNTEGTAQAYVCAPSDTGMRRKHSIVLVKNNGEQTTVDCTVLW